jgi:hypothetical protein
MPSVGPSLDLVRFEQLAERGRSNASAGRLGEAGALLGEALGLWRGEALEGLDEPGLAPARARLEELRLAVHELQADVALAAGRQAELLPELVLLARRHPLRERLQEQLMLALYRDGQQSEALAVFRRLRAALRDELGLEPQPRVRQLEGAILRQDVRLEPPAGGGARRTIVAAGESAGRLASLLAPLAASLEAELILLAPVAEGAGLAAAAARLEAERSASVRVAAFVTAAPGRDVLRLARAEGAELVVLEATSETLAAPLTPELGEAECDVALFLDAPGELPGSAVSVLFGASEGDWKAVELGAALARAAGVPLRLVGAALPTADASQLLARAALVVQRFASIETSSALFDPADERSLAASVAGGTLLADGAFRGVEAPAASRRRLASLGVPLCLVRAGLRPGLLAPAQALTRFSWSLGG